MPLVLFDLSLDLVIPATPFGDSARSRVKVNLTQERTRMGCARGWALTRLPILGCGLVIHLSVDMFNLNAAKPIGFCNIILENVVKPMILATLFLGML